MTTLPRALAPLRHAHYRWLAASLALSLLARGCGPWPWCGRSSPSAAARRRCRWSPRCRPAACSRAPCSAARWPTGSRSGTSCSRSRSPRRLAIAAVAGAVRSSGLPRAVASRGRLAHRRVAMGLYYPAYSALVPRCVPAGDLLAANGLEGVVRPMLAQAAGPAAAGLPGGRALARRCPGGGRGSPRWAPRPACAALPGDAGAARRPGGVAGGRAAGRRPRGLPLHGPDAVAAGHAAVRVDDAAGVHRAVRGAGAVRDQGRRRRAQPARLRAGRLRDRRRGRLAGRRLVAAARAAT